MTEHSAQCNKKIAGGRQTVPDIVGHNSTTHFLIGQQFNYKKTNLGTKKSTGMNVLWDQAMKYMPQ